MRSTTNFSFYCRESKKSSKTGLSPLELTIIINGKRVIMNTPYKFNPSDFNRKRKPAEIQDILDSERAKINRVMMDMADNAIPLTAENLRVYLKTGGVKQYTISDLFKDYLEIQKARVPHTLSKGVYRKYELVSELFHKTVDCNRPVTELSNADCRKFFTLLDGKYDNSTASGYKTKFKAFVTFGLDNNKIKINPCQGMRIIRTRKKIEFLSNENVEKIVNAEIENRSLAAVRDAFVLQLSSGISYADLAALRKEDIVILPDGTHIISKRRVKTGTKYTTVILKEGIDVLMRNGYSPRIISNQKYNEMLKALAVYCGVDQRLHSHLARHTFAQRLLSSGIRLETVSKILGHQNTKITQSFYCEIQDTDIIREVSLAFAN